MGCIFMIIISKKRIIILASFLCLCLFACGLAVNTENINKGKSVVETMSLPVTNKVIVIDAGHGKPDEGAQSSQRHN